MDLDQDIQPSFAPSLTGAGRPQSVASNMLAGVMAVTLAVILVAGYLFDRGMTHTALITPISPVGLTIMRALGTFCGLLVAFVVVNGREMAFYRKIILMLVIPCGGFALGDGIAWRIADHWDFGNTAIPYTMAQYPIVNVKGGGKSHTYSLEIDPYGTGESAQIAIPYSQHQALLGDFNGKCVTVSERRSTSGAIEISTLPANPTSTREAEVEPCGQSRSPWGLTP